MRCTRLKLYDTERRSEGIHYLVSNPEIFSLLLLLLGEVRCLLLFLAFKLTNLGLKNGVSLVNIIGFLFHLLKSFLKCLQLLLVVFLLLICFLKLETFMTQVLLKLADLLTKLSLIVHVPYASSVQCVELLAISLIPAGE